MELCRASVVNANKKSRYPRADVVQKVVEIKSSIKQDKTQSEAACLAGVPRTTAQYWLNREGKTGLSREVELFFESPAGLSFLHQLFISAHFSIIQLSGGGLDILAEFLNLSQLNQFIASSHGTLHKFNVAMEQAINKFGKDEKKRLSEQMPKKEISACQDETFHPEICLVAIEPVSNFVLLEEYSEKRDAASWKKAMDEALEGLPVRIIQSTSDEGTGLVKYVEKNLGAHHSSDLFHGQQEITRAVSAPMRAKIKQAEKIHFECLKQRERLAQQWEAELNNDNRDRSCSDIGNKAIDAEIKEEAALERLNTLKKNNEWMRDARKSLGTAYHPYDLTTGKSQSREQIEEKVNHHLSVIESLATDADLSENSMKRLEKARRVFTLMMTTINFFWETVKRYIAEMHLTPELETLVRDVIIPALYLEKAAKKAKGASERKRIAKLASELLARLELCNAWGHLPDEQQKKIKVVAQQCADLFQRSSSCVEGRNGYLSLRHHSAHRLSKRKLGALTVIHNYFIKRTDQTTAAERFFEKKPHNLFKFLLDNLDVSARPAKSRRVSKMAA